MSGTEPNAEAVRAIAEDTPDHIFELAGGFGFTDEIAVKLFAKWRNTQGGPVLVSQLDLAWLIDGYARSRVAQADGSGVG